MRQWRIADVTTPDVITVADTTPLAEIADVLTRRGVSAVPVADRFDTIVGVVSWTDLHRSIPVDGPDRQERRWRRNRRQAQPRWPAGTAVDVMSAPPVTIRDDASLPAAGRLMHRKKVGRLVVVDHNGRLAGIVTSGDLLKVHARDDTAIQEEVQRVLRRTLMLQPDAVQASAADGVVTLTGRTDRRTTALAAAALAQAVPGVTAVIHQLTFDTDDTAPTDVAQPVPDPLRDWWSAAAITAAAPRPSATIGLPRRGTGRPAPAPATPAADVVDEWGRQSFPASDPPANWPGTTTARSVRRSSGSPASLGRRRLGHG